MARGSSIDPVQAGLTLGLIYLGLRAFSSLDLSKLGSGQGGSQGGGQADTSKPKPSPATANTSGKKAPVKADGTPAAPAPPPAVDLENYGAPGFAWEVSTGNLVTIDPYNVIGTGFHSAELAAAGAADWWARQQANAGVSPGPVIGPPPGDASTPWPVDDGTGGSGGGGSFFT